MDINGRTFYEDSQEPKSPQKSWGLDSSRIVRSLQSPGLSDEEARTRDAAALLGYAEVMADAGTTKRWIRRVNPHAYPANIAGSPFSGNVPPWVYASVIPRSQSITSVTQGVDADGCPIYPDGWRYSVEYRPRPYNIKDDNDVLAESGPLSVAPARPDEGDALRRGWHSNSRYITKMVEPGAKALTLPNGITKFVLVVPETKPQGVPIGLPVPFFRSTVIYTWHLVPADAYPTNAINLCANAVNDDTFDGYDAETLLFSSARLTPAQGPFGDRLFNIEYRFIHQPLPDYDPDSGLTTIKGWNHFPGVINGQLRARQITSNKDGLAPAAGEAGNNRRIFKWQSFSRLFRPDQT